MFEFKIHSTGSNGNCYTMSFNGYNLMIDCGISFKAIMQKTYLAEYQHCLVTHSHCDHAKTWERLQLFGIKIAMSGVCKEALKADKQIKILQHKEIFNINDIKIMPLELIHSVYNLGFYIEWENEKIFFATDTSEIPYQFEGLTRIYIEANYEESFNPPFRNYGNHLSIKQSLDFVEKHKNPNLKEVKFLHQSGNFGDTELFDNLLAEVLK